MRHKRDVDREDLMNVKRGGKEENLPQMVRDYILHDRGNSLFLGDSFGNLPSPVGESPSIKKLFKFNEDDPIENKKRKNESKNQAIRIEGKKEKPEEKAKLSPDKDAKGLKIDLQEIDDIVFAETVKGPLKLAHHGASTSKSQAKADSRTYDNKRQPVSAGDKSINQSKSSINNPYEEEESYENPVNISKAPGCQDSFFDIRSEYANAGAAAGISSVNTSQDEALV